VHWNIDFKRFIRTGDNTMNKQEILSKVDHTLLKQTATWEQIKVICDEGAEFKTASVCIPPCFVKQAKEYVEGKVAICTVIGFPNGNMTTAAKVFETEDAVKNGADEIDMVINIGDVKAGDYDKVLEEIRAIKAACNGKLLKVIIETCLLTDEEKIQMCKVVTESGAEYIKTSTGFSTSGATFEDVKLMREHVGADVKVKAAGGISSVADAEEFIALGADRLGTSRLIPLLRD
jgi:deoxyribose-phosphate aldolase